MASRKTGRSSAPRRTEHELVTLSASRAERLIEEATSRGVDNAMGSIGAELAVLKEIVLLEQGIYTWAVLAEMLGVGSRETLMSYVKEKGLRCYRPGKTPLFLKSDVVDWIKRFPEQDQGGES